MLNFRSLYLVLYPSNRIIATCQTAVRLRPPDTSISATTPFTSAYFDIHADSLVHICADFTTGREYLRAGHLACMRSHS